VHRQGFRLTASWSRSINSMNLGSTCQPGSKRFSASSIVSPAGLDIDHRPGGFEGGELLPDLLQLLALL